VLTTTNPAQAPVTGTDVWLKLVKRGPRYQSYYSTDGTNWTALYETGASLTNVKAGVFAYNRAGTATDVTASFDYFRLATSATAPGTVGGSVPPQLSLSLGAPASFGTFTPGVSRDYTASTTADVVSTAGDAALDVSEPGHLTNRAFTLPDPLQVTFSKRTWSAPVSHDPVTIAFTQHIGATDPLRTGTYAKTLTFTLSTTNP
jgi:hypothetical protein